MNDKNLENESYIFFISLVFVSLVGIFLLFKEFLMPIIFATIISAATYPIFRKINTKIKSKSLTSFVMTSFISLIIFVPLVYLFVQLTLQSKTLFFKSKSFIEQNSINSINNQIGEILRSINFIDENKIIQIQNFITSNITKVLISSQEIFTDLFKAIINNSVGFFSFSFITIFTLYFLYKDGNKLVIFLKKLSPIDDKFDDVIIGQISYLSSVMLTSVFFVAILQGLSLGLFTHFYLGYDLVLMTILITVFSFIPIVGSSIVWLVISVNLFINHMNTEAILLIIYSSTVNSILIDNVLRTVIINKINMFLNKNKNINDDKTFMAINNFYIVIMSTIGGVLLFDIIGLFLGPIISSISITILNLYIMKNENKL